MKLIESLKIKEKAYIEKLENGLTVIIIPKNSSNKKYIIWGTHFGSIDNHFIMPDQNVTLRGAFTEVKYSVTYVFNNGSLPPNASSLLPEPRTYSPGETVVLADVIARYKRLQGYDVYFQTGTDEH